MIIPKQLKITPRETETVKKHEARNQVNYRKMWVGKTSKKNKKRQKVKKNNSWLRSYKTILRQKNVDWDLDAWWEKYSL